MLLQELKEHVFKLPPSDRLALVSAIIESLQDTPISELMSCYSDWGRKIATSSWLEGKDGDRIANAVAADRQSRSMLL